MARAVWWAVFALSLGVLLVNLPARYADLSAAAAPHAAALAQAGLAPAAYAGFRLALELLGGLGFLSVAAFICLRRPDDRLAWFSALFLAAFGAAGSISTGPQLATLHLGGWRFFTGALVASLGWGLFLPFWFLFPTGRLLPGGWPGWAVLAVWVGLCLVWNFLPTSPFSPLRWPPALFALYLFGMWGVALAAQVYRYRRRATRTERQQTKWLLAGFSVMAVIGLPLQVLPVAWPALGAGLGFDLLIATTPLWTLLIPLSIALAVLRYRLWAIDLVLNRALVYGTLTLGIALLYAGLVGALSLVFQSTNNLLVALAATGLAALLFQPARSRLQRAVNRLMYGERDEPYTVLARLRRQLETNRPPEALLPTLVATVAQALQLPAAALRLAGQPAVTHGLPPAGAHPRVFPLSYQGQPLGQLEVYPRGAAEAFTPAEERLLTDLALQAGLAAHAARLTADLQKSRERIVTAREEERRRLRRDLHDGLGPRLAGQTLKLEAALDALNDDPATARALLAETLAEAQTVLGDVRRLVYGLRPPALDQLGLLGALREQAHQAQLLGLPVELALPDQLPPLPAAVEVAAYYIAAEALTNVRRHAQATRCTLRLTLADDLRLEVIDNGSGLPPVPRAGIGLAAMRERAEELGGAWALAPAPGGGLRVSASLPLAPE